MLIFPFGGSLCAFFKEPLKHWVEKKCLISLCVGEVWGWHHAFANTLTIYRGRRGSGTGTIGISTHIKERQMLWIRPKSSGLLCVLSYACWGCLLDENEECKRKVPERALLRIFRLFWGFLHCLPFWWLANKLVCFYLTCVKRRRYNNISRMFLCFI